MGLILVHGAAVLENECADVAVQSPSHFFDSHVSSGAFHLCAGGQHLACGGCLQIAVVLLVEEHAVEQRICGFVVLRGDLYVEWTGCVHGHWGLFGRWSRVLREHGKATKREIGCAANRSFQQMRCHCDDRLHGSFASLQDDNNAWMAAMGGKTRARECPCRLACRRLWTASEYPLYARLR